MRNLEARLHLARQTPEISAVLELLTIYRDEALSAVVDKDEDREIEVGRVRGYNRMIRAISIEPLTVGHFNKASE